MKYVGITTVSFNGGVVKMMSQWRIREDKKNGSDIARVPPPFPGSADQPPSGGGRVDTIDAEEAALARELRMEHMRATTAKLKREREAAEGRAPAFTAGGAIRLPLKNGASTKRSRRGNSHQRSARG